MTLYVNSVGGLFVLITSYMNMDEKGVLTTCYTNTSTTTTDNKANILLAKKFVTALQVCILCHIDSMCVICIYIGIHG